MTTGTSVYSSRHRAVSTDDLNWRKSSFSGGGNCIEVADLPDGGRGVRDTKDNKSGPVLRFTSAGVAGVRRRGQGPPV